MIRVNAGDLLGEMSGLTAVQTIIYQNKNSREEHSYTKYNIKIRIRKDLIFKQIIKVKQKNYKDYYSEAEEL